MSDIFDAYKDVVVPPFNIDNYPEIVKWAILFLQEESGDFTALDESSMEILALTFWRVWNNGRVSAGGEPT